MTATATADRMTVLRERIARRALTANRTPANARIIAVRRIGLTIIVATQQDDDPYLPYCVDSVRLLTTAERETPEESWPYQPETFVLTGEWGGDGPGQIPTMLARATTNARTA